MGAKGVPRIISALKNYSSNPIVCEKACQALKNMADTKSVWPVDNNSIKINNSSTLQKNESNISYQYLKQKAEIQKKIGEEGGIHQIIIVLRTHLIDASVCKEACGALSITTRNGKKFSFLL